MLYMINPRRRKRRNPPGTKRKKPRTAAQKRATKKMIAENKRRARAARAAAKPKPKKRRKPTTTTRKTKGKTMAKKGRNTRGRKKGRRKSSGRITYTPVRGRIYRRNPRMFRGVLGQLVEGVKDAGVIVLGKGAAGAISKQLPFADGGATGFAKHAISAVIVGIAARRFLGTSAGRLAMAGALSGPIEGFIKGAGIPIVSDALGAYDMMGAYYQPVGSYPSLASYPSVPTVGSYEEEEYSQSY